MSGLVKALQQGHPVFGKTPNKLPWIGVIAADREWADARQWYDVAGVQDLPAYSIVDSSQTIDALRRAKPLDLLDTILTSDFNDPPPNSLLIIDPISYWTGGDMNRYMQVYMAMIGLNRLCLERQITILGLAHTGKQKGDQKERYSRPQDRINGSSALLGCSGTQMALETPDQTESPQYRFTWVPHHAPAESFWLDRDEETGLFIPSEAALSEASTVIPHLDALEHFPGADAEPISVKLLWRVIEAKHPMSRATLYRCLKLWCDQGLVEQVRPGSYRRAKAQ